ncbi:MAG: hypothetical protein HC875_19180 [Anaerolineales bacterium]|nr:hypothetical protein [Anaerolineales bacterium]
MNLNKIETKPCKGFNEAYAEIERLIKRFNIKQGDYQILMGRNEDKMVLTLALGVCQVNGYSLDENEEAYVLNKEQK